MCQAHPVCSWTEIHYNALIPDKLGLKTLRFAQNVPNETLEEHLLTHNNRCLEYGFGTRLSNFQSIDDEQYLYSITVGYATLLLPTA